MRLPLQRFLFGLWVLFASGALAATPTLEEGLAPEVEAPVRPAPCCDAAIVPKGHFEIEMNYAGDFVPGGFGQSSNLALKYSLTNAVQLQVLTSNLFVVGGAKDVHAFDGVAPGVKVVLLEQRGMVPTLAVSAHAVIPTIPGDAALQQTVDLLLMGCASKDFGRLHVDLNASATLINLTGTPMAQGGLALFAGWNFNDRWSIGTGPYSSIGEVAGRPIDGGWFVQAGFAPVPQLALVSGVEAGFFPATRGFSVFAGIAWVPTALRASARTSATQWLTVR